MLVDIRDGGGAISRSELELIQHDVETPTEHLQGLDLWLLRWAVEQSNGEIQVDTSGDVPLIQLRFPVMRADS